MLVVNSYTQVVRLETPVFLDDDATLGFITTTQVAFWFLHDIL